MCSPLHHMWLGGPSSSGCLYRPFLLGEKLDIWKFATNTEELVTWTGYFTETSHGSSHYSFHYNHTYFIQACVPLPFVVAVRNLQFNKTWRSITCINWKLYTCLNSSASLRNESLLILWSQQGLSIIVVTNKSPAALASLGKIPWLDLLLSYLVNCSSDLNDSLDGWFVAFWD